MKPSYWIPEERYYELRTFCKNYDLWKAALADIDTFAGHSGSCISVCRSIDRYSVEQKAMLRKAMADRIELVDGCARDCDESIGRYILEATTQGLSYDDICKRHDLDVNRAEYFDKYRRFYYLLSERKDN